MANLTTLCINGVCSDVPQYTAGAGIDITNNVISSTIDADVFVPVTTLPPAESADASKIYLTPKTGGGVDEWHVIDVEGTPTWDKFADEDIDLLKWTADEDGSGATSIQGVVQNNVADNVASGLGSLAEGGFFENGDSKPSTASGISSHAEGARTTAQGNMSHAEGKITSALGNQSHTEGNNTTASGAQSHAEGQLNTASGGQSHAEGRNNTASGDRSHAEGMNNTASGGCSHAEGISNTASGDHSHAEGINTEASGNESHAEGGSTSASGEHSHAEGSGRRIGASIVRTTASGEAAHAEGVMTTASGEGAHSEGTETTAGGMYSHAEGKLSKATGNVAHASGYDTIAKNKSQFVFGEYNVADPSSAATSARGDYVEIVGNGTADTARSNARTLDWSGNEVVAGKMTIGTDPTNSMDVVPLHMLNDKQDALTAGTNVTIDANNEISSYFIPVTRNTINTSASFASGASDADWSINLTPPTNEYDYCGGVVGLTIDSPLVYCYSYSVSGTPAAGFTLNLKMHRISGTTAATIAVTVHILWRRKNLTTS